MRCSILLTLVGFLAVSSALPIQDDECGAADPSPSAESSSTPPIVAASSTLPALAVSSTPTSSPSATPSSDPGAPDADTQAAIDANNAIRAQHGLQPLTFNATLASFADTWAKHDASIDQLVHDQPPDNPDMGENLFMTTGGGATFLEATNAWLSEAKNYNGEKIGEGDFAAYGHFTQCLWHSTTTVGFGKAVSISGATYITGRYFPAGNVVGQTPF